MDIESRLEHLPPEPAESTESPRLREAEAPDALPVQEARNLLEQAVSVLSSALNSETARSAAIFRELQGLKARQSRGDQEASLRLRALEARSRELEAQERAIGTALRAAETENLALRDRLQALGTKASQASSELSASIAREQEAKNALELAKSSLNRIPELEHAIQSLRAELNLARGAEQLAKSEAQEISNRLRDAEDRGSRAESRCQALKGRLHEQETFHSKRIEALLAERQSESRAFTEKLDQAIREYRTLHESEMKARLAECTATLQTLSAETLARTRSEYDKRIAEILRSREHEKRQMIDSFSAQIHAHRAQLDQQAHHFRKLQRQLEDRIEGQLKTQAQLEQKLEDQLKDQRQIEEQFESQIEARIEGERTLEARLQERIDRKEGVIQDLYKTIETLQNESRERSAMIQQARSEITAEKERSAEALRKLGLRAAEREASLEAEWAERIELIRREEAESRARLDASIAEQLRQAQASQDSIQKDKRSLFELCRSLSAEIESMGRNHPLQDYLDFTRSQISQLERELRAMPTIRPERRQLEQAVSQLTSQRDTLAIMIGKSNLRFSQLARQVRAVFEATHEKLIPPAPSGS